MGEGVGAAGNAVLGQAPALAASSEATRSQGWDRRRWIVLAASCLVNLCIGSLYAWSVFASPMAAYLTAINGFDGGSLAIVFSVANAVGPITMISGGAVNDRLGPRWVILAGGLLFGGIVTAFYGISSVLVPLIANALIAALDVTAAFKVLAATGAALTRVCASVTGRGAISSK